MTVGGAMLLLSLLAGAGIYGLAAARRVQPVSVFTGGDPLPDGEGDVTASDFSLVAETAFAPICRAIDPDAAYQALWRGVEGAAAGTARLVTPLAERHPFPAVLVLAAMLLLTAWWML
jgi:hypothetical protein